MRIPTSILYSKHHLWAKLSTNGDWLVGITDYAQDLLGDIVFIDAPALASILQAGEPCGLIESVKTGADLHAPADGEVIEINADLLNSPEQINDKPYEAWIFKFKPASESLNTELLSPEQYQALISKL